MLVFVGEYIYFQPEMGLRLLGGDLQSAFVPKRSNGLVADGHGLKC